MDTANDSLKCPHVITVLTSQQHTLLHCTCLITNNASQPSAFQQTREPTPGLLQSVQLRGVSGPVCEFPDGDWRRLASSHYRRGRYSCAGHIRRGPDTGRCRSLSRVSRASRRRRPTTCSGRPAHRTLVLGGRQETRAQAAAVRRYTGVTTGPSLGGAGITPGQDSRAGVADSSLSRPAVSLKMSATEPAGQCGQFPGDQISAC